jgi:hypothetical protein
MEWPIRLPLVPGHPLFGEFRKGNRLPGSDENRTEALRRTDVLLRAPRVRFLSGRQGEVCSYGEDRSTDIHDGFSERIVQTVAQDGPNEGVID